MNRSKIVLYGHFGSGNIGNDSSLEAALFNIRTRLPTTRIVCVCNGPKEISERFGIDAREIATVGRQAAGPRSIWTRLWRRASRLLERFDFLAVEAAWFRDATLFVVVGTGAVDDMAVRSPWGAPYDLFKWCLAARLGGARVVFLSVGVGPIHNSLSRRLMFSALRFAHRRTYRETAAIEYLRRHRFRTQGDSIYPDLVFSLDMRRRGQQEPVAGSPVRIGLGLINYMGWRHDLVQGASIFESYMLKIELFLQWLLERDYTVRLLVGDATDSPCVERIRRLLETAPYRAQQSRVVIEEISSIDALFAQIGQTDIVVASRFHNVLCSLMMRKPVISVGYHEKNDLLMAGFGLADFCQRIETLDVELLKKQFDDALVRCSEITERVHARLGEYRSLLEPLYSELVAMHEAARL